MIFPNERRCSCNFMFPSSRGECARVRCDDFRPAGPSVPGETCRRPRRAQKEALMSKIVAGITTSVDGYITGPDDGPECGLGVGGERLHYWVFGGPWSYESPGRGEPTGEDQAYLEETMADNGAVIAGRGTYEAAGHWGDANPWGLPFFIVTHRPAEQPDGGEFTFAGSLEEA